MNEYDEKGWAHIHQAAYRGYVKSIERFVEANPDQLELETNDDLHSTPFLLAVSSGNVDTVNSLLSLNAKINVINTQNHGAIELCCMKQFVSLLEYFIKRNDEKLPVWKHLLKMVGSDNEEEAENSGKCLRTLTDRSEAEGINANWEHVYNNGGIPVIVKVVKSTLNDDAKIPALQALLNVLEKTEVQEQMVSSGGIPAYIKILKSQNQFAVKLAAETLQELAKNKEYADIQMQNQVAQALLKVAQSVSDYEVLIPVVHCFRVLSKVSSTHRSAIGGVTGVISTLVGLYEKYSEQQLLLALTSAVGLIAEDTKANQNMFVDEGVTPHLRDVIMGQMKHRELQLTAVEAVHLLAQDNPHTQKEILSKGIDRILFKLLSKSRADVLLEKTAMALWALAGTNLDEQREMATGMGVQMLIEFLNSLSEKLHLIASEGLGVLAQGPLNMQTEIANKNGIHPLVRLLKSDKDYIGLSVIRTLRYLSVGVGNVPHNRNQKTISQSQGIRYLVALMVHSASEILRVESAVTLGYVSIGNQAILDEIHRYPDFSFVRILRMMYSTEHRVRLLAGEALAAFAYNNISQQQDILEQGGVRFAAFLPFLKSHEEFYRCNAAYQIVVLARIIPDEEQAKSSALGIKLIVDLLQDSKDNSILALASDCVARLAHTRAGVPSAIVAIEAVHYMCSLLSSPAEQVRGCAAIALGYLTFNHEGGRELLHRCRKNPYLMQVLKYYTKRTRLSPDFVQGWKHCRRVGLPAIPEGKTSLIQFRPHEDEIRPVTNLSFDGTGNSSNIRSSTSNLVAEEGNVTGRSSRSSRTHRTGSVHNSHMSLDSQRTQNSLMVGGEER
ncbi:ankyrin and armadillo repeat-containing protein-like [Haliotis rufescens]|uniref:ankyrin and armadillo repeat-containing protein-like n=1 Tax=Haliotis rufescens TaxID=6454 RepID=UPI00201F1AD2|nr:ankyrin and armadillo repeat-containing protein-like [Haliotis rufescens]